MAQTMTPSETITAGQIGKLQELLGARLRKSNLSHELVQEFLEAQGDAIADEMVAPIRSRVEARRGLILHPKVKVSRKATGQETLDATGRNQYCDREAVASMPKGEGEEVDMYYFKPRPEAYNEDGYISDDRLAREYEFFGLVHDPQAQVADNAANPAFADKHPNGTHWKGSDGKWYFVAFYRWDGGERSVSCDRNSGRWSGGWFFGGVRKHQQ